MRRRIVLTYVSLLVCVLVALAVPLAIGFAQRETQDLFIARIVDTARFAAMSGPVLLEGPGDALRAEIRRTDGLYGVAVLVLDIDGNRIMASRPAMPVPDPVLRAPVRRALGGLPAERVQTAWPWSDDPLVVAEPVGSGSQVLGAVVTVSPTDGVRADILHRWAGITLVGVVALAGSVLLAVPLARWTTRPVRDLDLAAHEITAGHLDARVEGESGPAELRLLSHSFNTMADRVSGLLERQRSFAADASHQLRNPLTALRLHLEALGELLDRDPEPGETSAEEEHRRAVAECDRLAAIVDDLLGLARAEVTEADLRRIDVAGAVADEVREWSRRLDGQVRLSWAGSRPAMALAYPGSVQQVLDVVLDNAVQFARSRVRVHIEVTDGWVDLTVADDGPGLAAEQREHARERFWRAPGRQNEPGTGLGLAIADALVEASQGEMALEDTPGGGLSVRVRLRQAPLSPDEVGQRFVSR